MPSPVTSADFDLSNHTGEVCEQITALMGLSATLKAWFEWAFDSDGNPTQEFKDAMAIIPVGNIEFRLAQSVPTGWLVCNGADVSRTTYANLFAVIGTNFGVGDGSTTFTLPNLQRRFPMGSGIGYAVGDTGGASTYSLTLTEANLPPHKHAIGIDPASSGYVDTVASTNYRASCDEGVEFKITAVSTTKTGYTEPAGGSNNQATAVSINTLPPFVAGLWLIKT